MRKVNFIPDPNTTKKYNECCHGNIIGVFTCFFFFLVLKVQFPVQKIVTMVDYSQR